MKKDYKDTLNLPKTDFPMKANLPVREQEVLQFWEKINLYKKIREVSQNRPRFILHDGPPYANGTIHLGTALNKTLKDIVVKSKILSNYDAPFVPGWDCHGLPIELQVEKAKGKAGVKLTHQEFRQACRDYAVKQVAIQKQDFIRLGVVGDWEHPYLTMDYKYEANAVRALAKIIEKGYFFQGKKPVLWCTDCKSALAEAEVEYKEKASPAIDVAFTAENPQSWFSAFKVTSDINKVIMPIWTTTPWTLPANAAVSVNPKMEYCLIACEWNGEAICLVLAEGLQTDALHRYGLHQYKVLGCILGAALENLQLKHPFLDRIVPVILGEHVTAEVGTGNVHTAPAHGQEDYVVSLRYNLAIENPVNAQSQFFEEVPLVGGMHVFKANEVIIAELSNRGKLLHSETIQHSFPHCWRHKTPLIFRATPQWFIGMEQNNLREQAMQSIRDVQWVPEWGQNRIGKMIESRPDWCVSRQRTWGIPLALFVHTQTQKLHPDSSALMEQVAIRIEKQGVAAWYDLDPNEMLGNEAAEYEKVTDILDVWFDSGVSHFCVLAERPELAVPADLYLEGSDQHRGWFQTSLLTAVAMRGKAPYSKVLTHGYVVDATGKNKMSKSLGNVIAPGDVIKQLGADVLRLWAASNDHTGDITVSDEILKRSGEAYRRIRNTIRFLLSNLYDFDPAVDLVAEDQLLALDRFAIRRTKELQEKIVAAYENYHFQLIYQLIHNFCSVEMGSFYLDIIKDRQYTGQAQGLPRRSGQTAMYHIIEAFVRWIAPILSFTAEEIWRYMPGKRAESVFLSNWYEGFPNVADQESIDWDWISKVRSEVNKLLEASRNRGEIGSGLEASVLLYADQNAYQALTHLNDELRYILITSEAKILPENEKDDQALATEIAGLWVKINVSTHEKCVRCWQRRPDIGEDEAHPDLCGRCVENVVGSGEVRKYA